MDRKGIKRKRYDVMKDELSVQLHKLTTTSGDFNSDVQAANEDFEQMCREISDRQADFLSRSLLLDEQYGLAISILEGGGHDTVGESSGGKPVLPPTYSQDVAQFVRDAKTSLLGHPRFLFEEYQQMQKIFKKHENVWADNMRAMIARAESIEKQKEKLCPMLSDFSRCDIESDSSTEDFP